MKRTQAFLITLLSFLGCLLMVFMFFPDSCVGNEETTGIESSSAIQNPDIPQSPRLRLHYFYRRGLAAYEAKNYRAAIQYFEGALKIDPRYRRADYYRREAWNNLAAAELAVKQLEQGKEAALTAPEISAAYDQGKKYLSSGRYEAAIRQFQKVLIANPEHQKARELLAESRFKLEKVSFKEQVKEAQRIMREEESLRRVAGEEEEADLREAYQEGRQLYQEGRLEPARREFTRVRKARDRYLRTPKYISDIDKALWEEKEKRGVTEDETTAIRKYTLGPEDVVNVVVRNHPEFSFGAKVEEDGQLIIPLTNEFILAKGLTRDELAEEIRKKLTSYVDNPVVKVVITGYNSKKYYVLTPKGGGSEFVMDKANMTLWDCMFRAGIPQLGEAALRRVQVITPDRTHPTQRWINVYAMLYQGKMENNIRVEPGTIIYYPMLAVVKFAELITDITKPVASLSSLGSSWEEWDNFRKDYLK